MPKKKTKKVKKPTSKKKPAKKLKTKAKKVSKKRIKAAKKKTAPKKEKMEGQLIGKISHFFPHVNAAVLTIKKGGLKIGDQILIKGHTTKFYEQILSMEIDRQPITEAKKGDEIGLQVKERVRIHDGVYKLNS